MIIVERTYLLNRGKVVKVYQDRSEIVSQDDRDCVNPRPSPVIVFRMRNKSGARDAPPPPPPPRRSVFLFRSAATSGLRDPGADPRRRRRRRGRRDGEKRGILAGVPLSRLSPAASLAAGKPLYRKRALVNKGCAPEGASRRHPADKRFGKNRTASSAIARRRA